MLRTLRPLIKNVMCNRNDMRNLLIAITFLITSNAYAFEPDNCEESLDTAIKIVFINDVLGGELESKPSADYILNGHPNICISSVSKNNKLYNWLIHKNVKSNIMIIEKIDKKSLKKHYYGPFLSEPKELKQKLINDLRDKAIDYGVPLKPSDFNEDI